MWKRVPGSCSHGLHSSSKIQALKRESASALLVRSNFSPPCISLLLIATFSTHTTPWTLNWGSDQSNTSNNNDGYDYEGRQFASPRRVRGDLRNGRQESSCNR